MCRVTGGLSSNPYARPCCGRDLPLGKITLVALSVILIGLGLAAYFYGPQILPQLFTTTTRQIVGAAILGGAGVLLDLALLIKYCCDRRKKRVETLAAAAPRQRKVQAPHRQIIRYGEASGNRFILTLGEQAFDQLALGKGIQQPGVVLTRTDTQVHIQAHNGVLSQEHVHANHFRFNAPDDCFSMRPKAEWTVAIDSEEVPIMIVFDDKFINTRCA